MTQWHHCILVNLIYFTCSNGLAAFTLYIFLQGLQAFQGRLLCHHVSLCAFWRLSGYVATNSLARFNLWTNDASLCFSNFSDAENWFCQCRPLYTGRLCQFSACERNPCSHGATCIPKSPLEAVCLCPYGRQGLLCEERKCYRMVQGTFNDFIEGLGCKLRIKAPWAG